MKIFVINLGSTSTKIALYHDERQQWIENIHHTPEETSRYSCALDQYPFRLQRIKEALEQANIPLDFDAIIARGGLLKPIPSGVYRINEAMKHDLLHAQMDHACNVGALLADELAQDIGCPTFIADPVVVDEMQEKARLTGIPGIERRSVFHALNSKAVSRRYAKQVGKSYEELNLIVAHLGGGISVSAHRKGKVIDVNNALNGEGPICPDRAGTLPSEQLAELCFSGRYTFQEIRTMICRKGGVMAHLGTSDMKCIIERVESGDKHARLVVDAMLYTIAKQIGAMHVALCGQTDAIILTGGIAYNSFCVDELTKQICYLAPVAVIPGENEMEALAMNAFWAMRGDLPLKEYGNKPIQETIDSNL